MDHARVAAALESLHDLLDEIERHHADLSPANRSKITRAVCRLLTQHVRSEADGEAAGIRPRAATATGRR
jgi:ATP-dependent helicase YprA (DUF1998 family)